MCRWDWRQVRSRDFYAHTKVEETIVKGCDAGYDLEAFFLAYEQRAQVEKPRTCRDRPWDKRGTESVQKTLDDLATVIAQAARKLEGADSKVAEDKARAKKEDRRLLELSRLAPSRGLGADGKGSTPGAPFSRPS